MNPLKFIICQIPVHLISKPMRIADFNEHLNIKLSCVNYAISKKADIIIFPEYTYDVREYSELTTKSKYLTILAGSFQDQDNFNQTAIFDNGLYYQQAKKNTSPYERTVQKRFRVKPSDEELSYLKLKDRNSFILTCFDYFELGKEKSRQTIDSGELVDLIFSPCCNNNPDIFLKEAESIHSHRDNLTSIICNVSKLKIDEDTSENYGKSAIFGLYDRNSVAEIKSTGWYLDYYSNLIAVFPDGDILCEIELQVPYHIHRMSSIEFTANPVELEFKELKEIIK